MLNIITDSFHVYIYFTIKINVRRASDVVYRTKYWLIKIIEHATTYTIRCHRIDARQTPLLLHLLTLLHSILPIFFFSFSKYPVFHQLQPNSLISGRNLVVSFFVSATKNNVLKISLLLRSPQWPFFAVCSSI